MSRRSRNHAPTQLLLAAAQSSDDYFTTAVYALCPPHSACHAPPNRTPHAPCATRGLYSGPAHPPGTRAAIMAAFLAAFLAAASLAASFNAASDAASDAAARAATAAAAAAAAAGSRRPVARRCA